MTSWYIWFILGIILLIFEALTPEFIIGSFALGSFVTAVIAFFIDDLRIQLLVFAITTIIVLWQIRPLFLNFLDNPEAKTNIDLLVGEKAKVIAKIGPETETGRVKIGGEDWLAISKTGKIIAENETVKIIEVQGAKVLVEKY